MDPSRDLDFPGDILITDGSALTTSTVTAGAAGPLNISAVNLQLTNGGQISSESRQGRDPSTGLPFGPPPTGPAGTITIKGISGSAQSVLIDGAGSLISTNTEGIGPGGTINMLTQSLILQNGGTLSASTSGTAPTATGGAITVKANQVQLNSGGLITASSTGLGAGGAITIGAGSTFESNASTVSSTATQAQGGNINIKAGQSVTLNNRSLITAKSEGPGNAGNILINAGQNYTSTDSAVTTQATAPDTEASGGNITVLATDTVQLTNNSQLNASVQGSSTTVGGNITIDPQYVILQNSQIVAQATNGQGGATNHHQQRRALSSRCEQHRRASSQTGVNGTVTIQNPNAPATAKFTRWAITAARDVSAQPTLRGSGRR
jgi:large exoprotein involved in heme utilization and adhesion